MHAVLAPLVQRGLGAAVTPRTREARRLQEATVAWRETEAAADAADRAAVGWREPLSAPDAAAALEIARRREASFWKFLDGGWRRVRGLVAAGFDAGDRQVRPTVRRRSSCWSRGTRRPRGPTRSRRSWPATGVTATSRCSPSGSPRSAGTPARSRSGAPAWPTSEPDDVLDRLPELVDAVRAGLAGLVAGADDLPLVALRDELRGLTGPEGQALVRAVGRPAARPRRCPVRPARAAAARRVPRPARVRRRRRLDARGAGAGARAEPARRRPAGGPARPGRRPGARSCSARTPRSSPRGCAPGSPRRSRTRSAASAGWTSRTARARRSGWPVGASWSTSSARSARTSRSGTWPRRSPGAVVAAMRPVWLMSPSSLSDTLPLEALFDVVIFDEASQIPVEEAVPALFRGAQVIVVGDRMQLPPTRYFQAGGSARGDGRSTTRPRSVRSSTPTASWRSGRCGSRRRCSPGTTAASTRRSSSSATPRSTRAGSPRSPTGRSPTCARGRSSSRSGPSPDPATGRGRRRRSARAQHQRHAGARRRLRPAHQPAGGRLDRPPGARAAGPRDRPDARHRRVLGGAAVRDRARAGAPGARRTPSSTAATTPS